MQKNKMFNFDYSYLSLPNQFYSITESNIFPNPEAILINKKLCNILNLSINSKEDLASLILGKKPLNTSFSQLQSAH